MLGNRASQIHPKGEVQVWALCRLVKFFHTRHNYFIELALYTGTLILVQKRPLKFT